jgi:transcriptional regulator with XRE-family HTH domain
MPTMIDPRKAVTARAVAGLSQLDVAAVTGLTPETISRIENGHQAARAETVGKLAKAYDVPVADLLRDPETAAAAS